MISVLLHAVVITTSSLLCRTPFLKECLYY